MQPRRGTDVDTPQRRGVAELERVAEALLARTARPAPVPYPLRRPGVPPIDDGAEHDHRATIPPGRQGPVRQQRPSAALTALLEDPRFIKAVFERTEVVDWCGLERSRMPTESQVQGDGQGWIATIGEHLPIHGVVEMMKRLQRIAKPERSRGQSVVEFALIVPVLAVLLLVTLDFGRLYMSYVTLNNVARVAANFGSTNPGMSTGTPTATAYNSIVGRESAGLACNLHQDAGGNKPPIPTYPSGTGLGGVSVASMTCDFSMLTPFVTNFFGGPLPITATAEFPIRTGAIANISGSTVLPPPGSPQAGFAFTGVSGGTVDGSGNVAGVGPISVNVIDTSQNAQTWDWSWGDQTPDQYTPLPSPAQNTFSAPGVYTVALTVGNTVGTSSTSHTVTVTGVIAAPVASFFGTPTGTSPQANGGGVLGTAIFGSNPLTVSFTNQSTGGSAYSWDFGDGGSSILFGPPHVYQSLGVFDVTLSITAPSGATPVTRTSYVTVGCVVPNFANTSTSAAQATWTAAGFTGTITYQPVGGNNGTKKSTPPSPAKNITSQEGANGGDFQAPTQQNKNSPWLCDGSINLRYTP